MNKHYKLGSRVKQAGFSLIEIMVVLVIAGLILAGVAWGINKSFNSNDIKDTNTVVELNQSAVAAEASAAKATPPSTHNNRRDECGGALARGTSICCRMSSCGASPETRSHVQMRSDGLVELADVAIAPSQLFTRSRAVSAVRCWRMASRDSSCAMRCSLTFQSSSGKSSKRSSSC